MFSYNVPEDERVRILLKEKRLYEAARYCFYAQTSRESKIMIIEGFKKERKIEIKAKSLFLLKDNTLRCLLCFCISTEKQGDKPRIIITKKKKKKYKTIC